MTINPERILARDMQGAAIARMSAISEGVNASGIYGCVAYAPPPHLLREYIELRDELAAMRPQRALYEQRFAQLERQLAAIPLEEKWHDRIFNLVTTEGKNAILNHFLKGSAYTASQVLGLIEDAGYTAVAAGNTAASITANASGSPANGWNEAQSSTCAARQTPSFGTASGGSLAATATAHSILAADVIKGAFLLCRSVAGTAPATTVGNTTGALYSCGLFTGGDRSVANGDTLNVTYTASA